MNADSLNATRRARELESLGREPVDVLVIGGGVTGAGVALDAAARGLSVVLAEKHDLAFGTSRWSSKLVHGGLRYLASGSVGIAHESAVERGILIDHTAPHLVAPFPQVVPLLPQVSHRHAALMRAGFLAGDALRASAHTSRHTLPRSRRITRGQVQAFAPTVRTSGLRGGLLGWDGQVYDDARLTIGIARTAAALGARVLTRCAGEQVTGHGAVLRDELTGRCYDVDARIVINATGVWAGQVAPGVDLRPSRGTHLVLSQDSFAGVTSGVTAGRAAGRTAGPAAGLTAGLTVPVPGSTSRFVFALPAPDHRVYVGITDEDAPGEIPEVPLASQEEIDFLLETVSSALCSPLTRADLLGTYSGLRPLLSTGGDSTADISRRHAVITAPDGLVTIVGGKLTTYRRMAQDALDAALATAGITAAPCSTRRLPLVGAASREVLAGVAAPARLVRKYGTEAVAVAADVGRAEAICEGTETTAAELAFAVMHEGALDEDDLLDRRTRIGLDQAVRALALDDARAAFDPSSPFGCNGT